MCRLEKLENRSLMSVSLDGTGCLLVQGTRRGDVISLSTNPYTGQFGVLDNGVFTTYARGAVKSVRIEAYAGDDRITASAMSSAVPIVVNGDIGNDTIVGGNADDVLVGGDGNDQINGMGGRDRLNGGVGVDTLTGVAGEDIFSGGAGNDLLNVTLNYTSFCANRGRSIVAPGEFANSASGADILNLKLDLGSLFRESIQPVIAKVQNITRGLQPVIDLYNTKIPIVSKYKPEVTFGSLLDGGVFRPFINVLDTINHLNISNSTGLISLGRFQISSIPHFTSQAEAYANGFGRKAFGVYLTSLKTINAQVDSLNATGGNIRALDSTDPFQGLPTLIALRDTLGKLGLKFPMLDNTTNIAKVVLGREMDLFTFSMDLHRSANIPNAVTTVLADVSPLQVSFSGKVSLDVSGKVVVDMSGIRSTGRLLDGFYVTSATAASVGINVTASASTGAPFIASHGVKGNLIGAAALTVKDLNGDGKVRLSEIGAGAIFVKSPPLSYSLTAFTDVWVWVPTPVGPLPVYKVHHEAPIDSGSFSL